MSTPQGFAVVIHAEAEVIPAEQAQVEEQE